MKIARDLKIGVIGPPGKTEEKPEELIRRLYIGGEIKSVAVYFTVRDDKVKISCVLWQLVEEGSVVGERDKAVRGLFRQKLEKYFDSAGQISPQGMEDFNLLPPPQSTALLFQDWGGKQSILPRILCDQECGTRDR